MTNRERPDIGTWQAHRGEVRGDAKVLLSAALGDPEAGHDLVKAQKSAIVCAQLPETLHANIKLR